jgi:hypothetical protein
MERCKEQWRSMSDKKKVVWINWALEDETRYQVRENHISGSVLYYQ